MTVPRRWLLGLTALLLAGVGAYASTQSGNPLTSALGQAAIVLSYIGVGAYIRSRFPDHNAGLLLILAGLSRVIPQLAGLRNPLLVLTAFWLQDLIFFFITWLVLIHPPGAPSGRVARLIVGGMGVKVGVVGFLAAITYDPTVYGDCFGCPRPGPYPPVVGNPNLAESLLRVEASLTVLLSLAAISLVIARLMKTGRIARRASWPVWGAGLLVFAGLIARTGRVVTDLSWWNIDMIYWGLALSTFLLPAAYVYSLLRLNLATFGLGKLATGLRSGVPEAGKLRELIAEALSDPSVELAFWARDQKGYVDGAGGQVTLPTAGPRRTMTLADRAGEPLAALIHDADLNADRSLIDSVGGVARLALENVRLQAELAAQLEEVRASRARLVRAADDERRRIERDIHDGAQQRLVSLALALGSAQHKANRSGEPELVQLLADAEREARLALVDLRELAHGIHPAVLTEQGLVIAIKALADRSPVPVELTTRVDRPLSTSVEAAAYYLVSEGLTNATKHARASRITIDLAQQNGHLQVEVADDGVGGAAASGGSGLRGLADRIGAVNGTLRIVSPPQGGTRLIAQMPCE